MKHRAVCCLLLSLLALFAAGCSPALKTDLSAELDEKVDKAVIEYNKDIYQAGEFRAESHEILGVEEKEEQTTVYMIALYSEYGYDGGKSTALSGSSGPVALTFQKTADGDSLLEYWQPKDGSLYTSSIKEKFPQSLYNRAISYNTDALQKDIDRKVQEYLAGKSSKESI